MIRNFGFTFLLFLFIAGHARAENGKGAEMEGALIENSGLNNVLNNSGGGVGTNPNAVGALDTSLQKTAGAGAQPERKDSSGDASAAGIVAAALAGASCAALEAMAVMEEDPDKKQEYQMMAAMQCAQAAADAAMAGQNKEGKDKATAAGSPTNAPAIPCVIVSIGCSGGLIPPLVFFGKK